MPLLHANVLGEGEDLIILHGFLGMSDNWKSLGKAYANKGYKVHLLDQRNHGKSFHDPAFSYALMAADLKAYMDANHIKNAAILGHSMGGKTAMYFAATQPSMTRKLLVADIGPKSYPPHHSEILKAMLDLHQMNLSSRLEAEEALEQRLKEPGVRQFLLKNLYWETPEKLSFRANIPVLFSTVEAVGEALPENFKFEEPTLFLAGQHSGYILAQDHLSILHQFPAAQIETIAKAGHWLHAENPTDFFKKTMRFLEA